MYRTGKKFISYKVFFITLASVLVFGGYLAEFGLRKYVVQVPNTEPYRAHRFYQHHNTITAIGDSHIFRSFLIADNITNLGRGGSSLQEMDYIIRRFYQHHDHHNQQLILQASHQLLSQNSRERMLVDNAYTTPRLGQFIYLFEPAIATHVRRFFDRPFHWLANIEKLQFQADSTQRWIERGAAWQTLPVTERLRRARIRARGHQPVWDERSNELLQQLHTLLTDLNTKGVRVCLLKTPLAPEYRQAALELGYATESDRAFKQLTQETQETQVAYVDFQTLALNWDAGAFANEDHLSPHLSHQFSQLVQQACFGQAH